MKKRGFTLAEILITLGIIAVASAILAPAIMNMRPDRYKFKVLECYKVINDATEAMLSNPEIYYRKPIDSNTPTNAFLANGTLNPNTQYGCNGLRCNEKPTLSQFNDNKYSGVCKYPNLIADFLKLENITYCNNSSTSCIATGHRADNTDWTISFVSPQAGGRWRIDVDVDLSANSSNCTYQNTDNNKCLSPDTFSFTINSNGDISGLDQLTRVYLSNMANTDKSADFEEAAGQ